MRLVSGPDDVGISTGGRNAGTRGPVRDGGESGARGVASAGHGKTFGDLRTPELAGSPGTAAGDTKTSYRRGGVNVPAEKSEVDLFEGWRGIRLSLRFAITANHVVGRAVVIEFRLARVLEFRDDPLGELFAELDA